jgi:hypothetical protein
VDSTEAVSTTQQSRLTKEEEENRSYLTRTGSPYSPGVMTEVHPKRLARSEKASRKIKLRNTPKDVSSEKLTK